MQKNSPKKVWISSWFYSAPDGEKIYYPGVGSDSDTWDYKNIYWNCLYSFYESAVKHCISNSRYEFEFIFFVNDSLPDDSLYKNGFSPIKFFNDRKIRIVKYDPLHVNNTDSLRMFGTTQFALIDIFDIASKLIDNDDLFMIFDSDCIFVKSIPEISYEELSLCGTQILKNHWSPDEVLNGAITNKEFNAIASKFINDLDGPINHYVGGEFFGFKGGKLQDFLSTVKRFYQINSELGSPLNTEEQLFTAVISDMYSTGCSESSTYMRRIWTDAEKFRNAMPSDSELSILHLPAEKKKGFQLFAENYIFSAPLNTGHLISYAEIKSLFNLE